MREYKFRGIAFTEQGANCLEKFVYGSLITADNGDTFIVNWKREKGTGYLTDIWQVKPETVGQYTGLQDRNGKEIYEKDILDSNDSGHLIIQGMAEFRKGRYVLGQTEGREDNLSDAVDVGYTVIGNIYENPELLEVESNDQI